MINTMTSQYRNVKTPTWVIVLAVGLGCLTLVAVFLGTYFLLGTKNKVVEEVVVDMPVNDAGVVYTIEDMYYVCSERHLNYMDIRHFTKGELRIVRNQIFAKHGYKFNSRDLQEYFGQQSWYFPRYNDVSSFLTAIERDNVEFIQAYE